MEHAAAALTAMPLTLAAWFNSADNTNSQDILGIYGSTTSNQYRLNAGGNATGDPVRAVIDSGGGPQLAATTTGYSLNTWHHACGVFTSSSSRMAKVV